MKNFHRYLEIIQEASKITNRIGITDYYYSIDGKPKEHKNLQEIKAEIRGELLTPGKENLVVTIDDINKDYFIDDLSSSINTDNFNSDEKPIDRIRSLDEFLLNNLGKYKQEILKNIKEYDGGIELNFKRTKEYVEKPKRSRNEYPIYVNPKERDELKEIKKLY